MTRAGQHETMSRRVVRWLGWLAQRVWGTVTQRGEFRWREVLWVVATFYAVIVAGFSGFLVLRALALWSTAGSDAAVEAAALTASAAAVTALATIALVWTAVQQAAEARKRAAPVSMRWYTRWTKRPYLENRFIQPGSEGTRPIRDLYRAPLAEHGQIALEFTNAGALTESVEEIKVVLGDGAAIPYRGSSGDYLPCPFDVPPRGSITVLLDPDATYHLAAYEITSIPGPRTAQAVARLGSGLTLRSEKVPLKSLQHEERDVPVPGDIEEVSGDEEQPEAGDG